MTNKVLRYFTDLQDNDFAYNAGDTYPRKGTEVSPSRIAELAGSDNKRGVPLIELVEEATPKVKAVEDEAKDETEAVAEVKAEEKPKTTRTKKNAKK